MPKNPTFHEERLLMDRGFSAIAGLDEAGAGCWAGPVVAGAVILPLTSRIVTIRDSKLLTEKQRIETAEKIKEKALAWGVGIATVGEVDALNVRGAGALAMRRAVADLDVQPDYALIDAFRVPDLPCPQKSIVRGDLAVKSIAAASIIAKTFRDALMAEFENEFPGYGFVEHKGYGTAAHRKALDELGPCPIHRMSYVPIRETRFRGELCVR